MAASHVLELIEHTDPYCTWCWGAEPILRKIEEVYAAQVRIAFRMGGLVADISTFYDPSNRIGGPKWYEQVAAHWLEASARHGMPVDERIFFDLKDSGFSTFPASIAYKSAQFQDEASANIFLRRMREGAAAERRDIQRLDVQRELAEEVGLDGERFAADIESGRAAQAFEEDLSECRRRGISGFPTFLVRNPQDGQEILLPGYRRFAELEGAFRELSGDALRPAPPTANRDTILAFVRKYGKVAAKEITEVFDLTGAKTDEYITLLVSEGRLTAREVGNGFFYAASVDG